MKFSKALTSAFLLGSAVATSDGKFTIDPEHRVIRDGDDRHVIFHGVNVVYKVDPYLPGTETFDAQTSLDDEDIDNLVKWGFNFVRLGVMWEGVETAQGVYNEKYLKEVNDLVNKLGEKGIYTLIDSHQDAVTRLNCGEGMPTWAAKMVLDHGSNCLGTYTDKIMGPILRQFGACKSISSYGYRYENGLPVIEDCQKTSFFMYYTSPESMTLFRALYNNDYGLQDAYVAFQGKVAQAFSANKYVVGYDPINEPMPGWDSLPNLIDLFTPGHFDKQQLAPLYAKIQAEYQKASKDNIMMFEPGQFPDMIGLGPEAVVWHLGFEKPPGGEIGSANHVLNDHTYCCQLGANVCAATGEPSAADADKCLDLHQKRIGTRDQDAKKLGIPLIMSEFGACMNSSECVTEVTQVTDVADQHLAGWAYWEFKTYKDLTTSAGDRSEGFYNYDNTLQTGKVKALSRSYVKAAQGTTKSMNFDTKTGNFEAVVQLDLSIEKPTLVHAHQDSTVDYSWYPHGINVNVTSVDTNATVNAQTTYVGNEVQIMIHQQALDGSQVRISITPKQA